jgi:hypothetical protein
VPRVDRDALRVPAAREQGAHPIADAYAGHVVRYLRDDPAHLEPGQR